MKKILEEKITDLKNFQKTIYVYEKDTESLNFLKCFFKNRSDYSVVFMKSSASLNSAVSKKNDSVVALITGTSVSLEKINMQKINFPVIAMVTGNISEGINYLSTYNIDSYLIKPFYKEDLDHKINIAINNKSLVESVCTQKKDLETIIELTYLVSSTLDPTEVLYFVVRKIAEITEVTRCSIISIPLQEKSHAYVISTYENVKKAHIKLDLKKYPEIRKALATKNTVFIKDALKDPLLKEVRSIIAPLGIKSIVVIPIIFRHEVIGTLFLRTSRKSHTFTDKELRLFHSIANASTNALYNSFLYEKLNVEKLKLEKCAAKDYLTGIYNIRYFYGRLSEEFNRASRHKIPFACIMFDIDNFKKINDTYGHRTGDAVLREFAQYIRKHTRKCDIFARYGGDEFIMFLPQTSEEGALAEARRLRTAFNKYKFKSLVTKHRIAVSIGIASYPNKKVKKEDDIITLADNAMLLAKKKGKDSIAIFR
ncbi:MAG: sensor domain-containing diguanylate cyclase [Nitrospiraceae bacterium]|nr:sensor domain-containing diguanylate cyclase [Nitrospiraceae bacterium]